MRKIAMTLAVALAACASTAVAQVKRPVLSQKATILKGQNVWNLKLASSEKIRRFMIENSGSGTGQRVAGTNRGVANTITDTRGDAPFAQENVQERSVWDDGILCTRKTATYKSEYQNILTMNKSSVIHQRIYPGALYRAAEIVGGTYAPFSVAVADRNPVTLQMSVENFNGTPTSETVEQPSSTTISAARGRLFTNFMNSNANVPAIIQGKFTFANSSESFRIQFGLGVELPELNLNVAASAGGSTQRTTNKIVIKMSQEMYSVFLAPDEISGMLKNMASAPNDLLTVSGVTYGRELYMVAESEESIETMAADLKATLPLDAIGAAAGVPLPPGTTGVVETSTAKSKLGNKYTFSLYFFGGDARNFPDLSGVSADRAFTVINTWMKDSKPSTQNVPIVQSYILSFAKTGAIATVQSSGTVNESHCLPVLGYIDIRPHRLEVVKHVDFGDDEEVFGEVEVFVQNKRGTVVVPAKTLWEKPARNFVRIKNGGNNALRLRDNSPVTTIDLTRLNITTAEQLNELEFVFRVRLRDVIEKGAEETGFNLSGNKNGRREGDIRYVTYGDLAGQGIERKEVYSYAKILELASKSTTEKTHVRETGQGSNGAELGFYYTISPGSRP